MAALFAGRNFVNAFAPHAIGRLSQSSYLRGNRGADQNRPYAAPVFSQGGCRMHQIVSANIRSSNIRSSHRWWVLATVVAAQFMFGVDAFIVNVAIPTIAAELHTSSAQIESVIAVYLIAYATLVVTGGRLGDIYGTKSVFIAGVLGFVLTSLWCGLAQSGAELIIARLAQGATAAMMVPQVLATIHLLFSDAARSRAFGIYGIVLGLAGAAGFALGGLLVTSDLAGLGWRVVFFVNVPFGLIIIAFAAWIVPSVPRRAGTQLDVTGAIVLFCGLLCLIGPMLFGRDLHWAPWLWLVMAAGIAIIAAFLQLERRVAQRGGMPLIDLTLLSDAAFMRGLYAAFFFFFTNLSFYLIMTIFMQRALHIPPLQAGLVFVPLALTFVVASRHSGVRARRRGTLVLIEGCGIQVASLAVLALTIALVHTPSVPVLTSILAIFGYGQGLVMAPLSSVVLSTVKPASAGAGSGIYSTTSQIANASGVALIGAVFFAVEAAQSARLALLVSLALFALSIVACVTFLTWMRRAMVE
jgi:EmrB/QacA subfamily drug resistance transporter